MRIGLVVGRFQPFHKGHLYLFRKALKSCDKIIIAIGSSNISDENNPMSYKTRLTMIKKVINEERIGDRVIKIISSPDNPSDGVWLDDLLKNAGKFNISFGNNYWTNGILKNAGYEVVEIPFLKRNIYQGIHIRELMKNGGEWKHLIPEYLIDFIKKKFSGVLV